MYLIKAFITKNHAYENILYTPFYHVFTHYYAQSFQLIAPNTAKISMLFEKNKKIDSKAYLYLKTYYPSKSKKKKKEYFKDDEGNQQDLCGFKQKFDRKIRYEISDCLEARMGSEILYFPKTNTTELKKLINTLFYDVENKWTSELKYEPDGVGCYYEIKQTKKQTLLIISCGC